MEKEEFEGEIVRRAIGFQVGGFRSRDTLFASWIGNVTVGKEGELWPISNGKPMIPICQLNLKELPKRPDNLQDIEMLTLFMDADELPSDQPNGDG